MKKTLGILILSGLCLYACEYDSYTKESTFDNANIKEDIKTATVQMFLSRPATTRSSSFNLTDSEKQLLAQHSLRLLRSYGLSDTEISAELDGITVEKLIDTAYAIINIEDQASKDVELIDVSDGRSLLTGEVLNPESDLALTRSAVFDCAMQALGISVAIELMRDGISKMSKSAVKKLLKKVASKYLGWVGTAIAVYEFGDCMEWW